MVPIEFSRARYGGYAVIISTAPGPSIVKASAG